MHVCRTSETVKMTGFANFYNDLLGLVEKHEKNNIPIKLEQDLDNDIVKLFGENISSLARAKNGLNDVSELALATAEHHPFWNLLYNCSEISNLLLDKWKDHLTKEDVDDIEWAIKELTQSIQKIKESSNHSSRQR